MKRAATLICCVVLLLGMTTSAQNSNANVMVWPLVGGDISTLNPVIATDSNSLAVISAIYDGLFTANPTTGLPEPELATWTVSDDGLVYTFTLRDAQWSDGRPITAADVKFTFDATMSDKVLAPRRLDMTAIQSVEVRDEKTAVVTLSAPNCTIWGNVFSNLVPLPAHKYKADFSDFMTSDFNTHPTVASGVYLFDEHQPGEYVRLKANPRYWAGTAKIPQQLFRIIKDPNIVLQALQTDSIDTADLQPDQYEQLPDKADFYAYRFPDRSASFLIMNYQDPDHLQNTYDEQGKLNKLVPNKFFADLRVRQAVAMGYNKQDIAATLGENGGSPLAGPIIPLHYNTFDVSSVKPWAYDPDKARALLAEAGWRDTDGDGVLDKDGVKFEVDLVYSKLNDLWGNAALIVQDQLGQIGIKINIIEQEWNAYLDNVLLAGKFNMTVVGFSASEVDGIAADLLDSHNGILGGGGYNVTGYVNPEVDTLLHEAHITTGCDVAERTKIYTRIQQIAHDDVAYDWLVSTSLVSVLNKRVQNARFTQWQPPFHNTIIGWSLGS